MALEYALGEGQKTFFETGGSDSGVSEAREGWKDVSLGYRLLGGQASDDAEEAAKTAAQAEMAKLEYLQEREALPLAFRDAAMMGLGSEYGLTFDENGYLVDDGMSVSERALASPMYQQQLQEGESAIGRGASATGRLRGGATPTMLGSNAQDAYVAAYNNQMQGLRDFAYGPTNTNKIADTMGNVGNLLSQGQIAAAQAQQQGLGTAAGLGLAAISAFSDPRLKDDVKVIGSYKGVDWCTWVWNKAAEKLGLKGEGIGVMADQLVDKHPDCVGEFAGYLTVDYGRLENA